MSNPKKRKEMAIKTYSLNKLPNAFHFETVLKTLERIGATSVAQENMGVRPLFTDLQAKFQREDTAYRQSLKNFKTDEIKRLDDERDAYADCIRRVAEEWGKLPDATRSAAGKLIAQVYKDFQFRTTEARIAETAKLLNMFQEFDRETHVAALRLMGLTELMATLREKNAQLKQLMAERSSEQADYVVGELRAARLEVDEAYTKLIQFLNALLLVSPSDELTQLEKVLNADIRLLEAQLAASRKRTSSDTPEDKDGGEDEGGASSSGNGDGAVDNVAGD